MVIQLGEIEIDLVEELDFNFELNDQQLDAIKTIVEFIHSDKASCTLQGSAGVGKTTIVKIIMHYLMLHTNSMYLLCAPTHKARVVLQTLSDDKAETLHAILNLKPNLDLDKYDARDLDFLVNDEFSKNKKPCLIPYGGVLIIDEASMINNDLYKLIIKKAKEYKCRVLFIGDIAQLQPVKQGEISMVFQPQKDNYRAVLTKIERQKGDNPILDTLSILRDEPVFNYETAVNGEVGMVVTKDVKEFCSMIKNNISPEVIVADPYRYRILTYTNKRVASFNALTRKILRFDSEEICKGDLLMAYDNVLDRGDQPILVNSCDYLVEKVIDERIYIPEFGHVDGYKLWLKDLNEPNFLINTKILYLIRNDLPDYIYTGMASVMEGFRQKAIAAKKARKTYAGMFWRKFYEMNEAIHCMRDITFDQRVIKKKCIDYGYAHTIHKSQGVTYENIFVDMISVTKCQNIDELRQLQYVALSRVRKKAYLLT